MLHLNGNQRNAIKVRHIFVRRAKLESQNHQVLRRYEEAETLNIVAGTMKLYSHSGEQSVRKLSNPWIYGLLLCMGAHS